MQYRDGASWIAVERELGPSAAGRVHLRAGDREFDASVDARAVVQLAPGSDPVAIWQREQLRAIQRLSRSLAIYQVEGRAGEDGLDIASRLAAVSGVREAIPDLHLARRAHAISIPPDDPHYGGQWYLRKLSIERAWRLSSGDPGTTVVVIDDGCDMQHPDLVANLLEGRDLIDMDDDPGYAPGLKGNGHGTQCAGLIAAQADNGIGIAGVCPECSLRCVRLLRDDDQGIPISSDIQAFDYALEIGAAVVSNSWGFAQAMPAPAPLRAILERIYQEGRNGQGALVIFSAGNENRELRANEIDAVTGVLSIGAINNFDESAPFSNFGASLALAAPTGTYTTDISGGDGEDKGDYTDLFGGTSSACPIVAGVAGLVMSARPDMRAEEVHDLLISTARSAPFAEPDAQGHDPVYGYGIVDPVSALRSALGVTDPEPEDAGADAAVAPEAKKHESSCTVDQIGAGTTGIAPVLALLLTQGVWRLRKRRGRWL